MSHIQILNQQYFTIFTINQFDKYFVMDMINIIKQLIVETRRKVFKIPPAEYVNKCLYYENDDGRCLQLFNVNDLTFVNISSYCNPNDFKKCIAHKLGLTDVYVNDNDTIIYITYGQNANYIAFESNSLPYKISSDQCQNDKNFYRFDTILYFVHV